MTTMNLAYFMEQCPDAVIDAWRNNWNGAMYAFLYPRLARAWDKLSDKERASILQALNERFGLIIRLGTVGDMFYYFVESRLRLISLEVGQDLLDRREIIKLVTNIVGRVKNPILDLVYPPVGASQPLHRTTTYKNAYPYVPAPPSEPPPEEPASPRLTIRLAMTGKGPVPPDSDEQSDAEIPAKKAKIASDTERESSDESDEDEAEAAEVEPAEAEAAEVEPAESEVEQDDEEVFRKLLADTDDEADADTAPAPLPVFPEDITISMKVVMFHRYMLHIGNTKHVRINPLPAIQICLSPAEFADLKASFPNFENATADGWWRSAV